jgi:hypothetical protein
VIPKHDSISESAVSDDPRYPIGRFTPPREFSPERIKQHISVLRALPLEIRSAVEGLSEEQLDTPYRDGGWTVRQVVHHVADSHINSCSRIRTALIVEAPTISAYDEGLWAELEDARTAPIQASLSILDGLHARWVALFSAFPEQSWGRTMIHPEYPEPLTLWGVAALYDWHSRHHVAHITTLRQRQGW